MLHFPASERVVLRRPVPVLLTWTSFVPAALLGGLFVVVARNTSGATIIAAAIAGAIGGAISLVVHELGHVRAARRADGVAPVKVALIAFGAATYLDGRYRSGRDQARVALAGPAASLLLAIPLVLAMRLPVPEPVKFASFLLALLNVGIAVVSLLPVHPLDGHKLMVGSVWSIVGTELRARRLISRATHILMVFEALGSVVLIVTRPVFGGAVVMVGGVMYLERLVAGRRNPAKGPASA